MTPIRIALFLSIVVTVLAGWHYYLWARLVRDPAWPRPVGPVLTGLLILLAVGPLVGMILRRTLGKVAIQPLLMGLYVWIGAGFMLLMGLVVADLLRSAARLAGVGGGAGPEDPERRILLARSVAVAASLGAAAVSVRGVRSVLGEMTTPEVPIRLARLPKQLDGLTIAQLTDIHIGSSLGGDFLKAVVERTNELRPDAIVITGDLVDGSVAAIGDEVAHLAKLRSRYGTYFITGNHEYYSGHASWIAFLKKLGIPTLANERVLLGDQGPGGATLDLAGIHDFQGASVPGHAPDLETALEGRDPERELVLLAHQPKAAKMAADAGAGLMLSGHTHGGQIQPFGALVRLVQPFLAGHHRKGDTQIYVSRGTGVWGPPMRIGAPAEISQLILTSG